MRRTIVIVPLMLCPLSALAASYTVCDSGCNHTTIAAALSAAGSGNHTITVKAPYGANERTTVSQSGTGAGAELTIQANTTGLPGSPDTITTTGFVVNGSYVIIKGFVVAGSTASSSIDVQGSHVQILNNKVSGNTNSNGSEIGVRKNNVNYASDVTISGNKVFNTHGWPDDWVLLQVDCINCTISHNDLSGKDIDVLRIWGHDNRIHHNYIHDITGSTTSVDSVTGKLYCLSSGSHADIVQVYAGCGGSWCQTSYNMFFYDNVAKDSYCQMFNLSNDGEAGIHDFHFYNNVFIDFRLQGNVGTPNTHVMNNVFIDIDPVNKMVLNDISGGGFDDTGLIIENNVFLQNYDQKPFTPDAQTTHRNNYVGWHAQGGATFSAVTGWSETAGVYGGDPGFIHYVGNDYDVANDFHIVSGSILRGKGIAIAGMTLDADDQPWASPPSIGAYEYTSSVKPDAGPPDARPADLGGCSGNSQCNDNNACTADTCDPTSHTCQFTPISGCCTSPDSCDDGTKCTTDSCDSATHTCKHQPVAGCCSGDADCKDIDPCTTDTCDVATGACSNAKQAGCCSFDTDCDDSSLCTLDKCDITTNACAHTPVACGDLGPAAPDAAADRGPVGDAAVKSDAAGRAGLGGGCGCEVAARPAAPALLLVLVGVLVAIARRRRHRV